MCFERCGVITWIDRTLIFSIWKQSAALYIFFWVFPRRQIVVGRRFGTLCQFHLQRLVVQCERKQGILYPLHTLKEKRDKHTAHNNPTVTWHASFIPPHPPTYPEPPTTWCPPSPLVRPALVRTSVGSIKYLASSHTSPVHPAFEDGTDTGFWNVGQLQFDAGEIPRRNYTIFKSRRKSEIKKVLLT